MNDPKTPTEVAAELAVKQGLLLLKQITRTRHTVKMLPRIIETEVKAHLAKFPAVEFKEVGKPVYQKDGTAIVPIYFKKNY